MKFIAITLIFISQFAYAIERDDATVTMNLDTTIAVGKGADILFVIDDSGSMAPHQQNLANTIDYFSQELASIATADRVFHIGVTTTSVGKHGSLTSVAANGELYNGVVTTSDSNWQNALKTNLMVGVNGSSDEKSYDAVSLAISASSTTGFHRKDTPVYLIFVTDELNQIGMKHAELLTFLDSTVPSRDFISASAFIPIQTTSTCPLLDTNNGGDNIVDFVTVLGGSTYDLCDSTSLVNATKDLSENITAILKEGEVVYRTRAKLIGNADITSITVHFAGSQLQFGDLQHGFMFDSLTNEIVFGKLVDFSTNPNEQIHVSYQLKGF